ncbi:signal transduction histidine kinase [Flavobacterium sp. 1]|uniref:tetratricopeptide repeat-containing sensor histidine kinase n=1 Tax=Flavobacterium sp. 1 TaxID=2035200 RepID=UPI000C23FA80|nr:tetratricopeptide repeat-containing sensor histidine kinase [Flavobacterium sp. 1]PJJ08103.1 signal transduction histidine kinase [Flavobacterium sp. 1]
MKLFTTIFIFSIFFIGCERKNQNSYTSNANNLDSLISTSTYKNITKEERLEKALLASEIIQKNDTLVMSSDYYFELADSFFQLGESEKCIHLLQKLYQKSILLNDNEGIQNASYSIAIVYNKETKYDSAYYYFTKSEKVLLKEKNENLLGNVKIWKAEILSFKNDYVGAEKLAIEALKYGIEKKNNLLIYNCYLTLGSTLVGLDNYEKAVDYYNKAIEISEKLKSNSNYLSYKCQPYNHIANIYVKTQEYEKAIAFAKQGLAIANFKKVDPPIYCYLTNKLAYSKFKLGNKSSLKQFEETLKIGDRINNIPVQITSKTYLGEYYLNQKNYSIANYYLKEALLQARKNNLFEDELTILKLLTLASPQNEFYYTNKYIYLKDSLQDVERTSRNKYARIEFETDQIIQEKIIAENKKNEISKQFILYAIMSALVLLLLLIILYRKNNNIKLEKLFRKQEQALNDSQIYNLMLSNQQKMEEGKLIEKQRISRDLHDGIIGKLSAIRMNLYEIKYSQSPESIKKYLEHIAEMKNIEEEIRNLTHELNTNVFSGSDDFETTIKALFTELNNNPITKINIAIDPRIDWSLVDINVKMNLYRVFQEALQNINKYADAYIITIAIAKSETGISIQIADNGKGFDLTQAKKGIGLKNMNHRAMELKGQFSIESKQNIGTKINLSIPIEFNSFEF